MESARTGGALALAAAAALVLGGCSAGSVPEPEPTRPVPTVAPPRPSVVPTRTPATSATRVSTADLVCVDPTGWAMRWLRDRFRDDLPASDVVMVEVGPGDDPSQTWWIVEARSTSDGWGDPTEENPLSFLATREPDGAVDAISVGRALEAAHGTTDWSKVSWEGARLARGEAAQKLAVSCLAVA
ncbi:hypothetical protein IC607_03200 [Cellulomonas sp. JH27-2]|uniref:hypothetical protein n=1 Tax=Cellulomonas sp. JH27-2 TaxID=2774139 RepID=UPI001780E3F7|nr:hypothetical protein [Cellulomonas sp. JH27-2]MBD8057971.1 hypothetical protein [Cellulomonas sp. JH27-2]